MRLSVEREAELKIVTTTLRTGMTHPVYPQPCRCIGCTIQELLSELDAVREELKQENEQIDTLLADCQAHGSHIRELQAELKQTQDCLDNVRNEAKKNARRAEQSEQRLVKVREIIDKAPHDNSGFGCGLVHRYADHCNCWKAAAVKELQ
jgi:chromosome segregation ATPase